MKLLLLIGGALGFGIGLTFSWAQESSWPSSLWHGCLAAYIAGILFRWWGRAWRKNLAIVLNNGQAQAALELPSNTKPIKS